MSVLVGLNPAIAGIMAIVSMGELFAFRSVCSSSLQRLQLTSGYRSGSECRGKITAVILLHERGKKLSWSGRDLLESLDPQLGRRVLRKYRLMMVSSELSWYHGQLEGQLKKNTAADCEKRGSPHAATGSCRQECEERWFAEKDIGQGAGATAWEI